MRVLLALLLTASFVQPVPPPFAPAQAPLEIAANTFVIRATPMPGRGPDGNTIIFDAPDGLIVVDTGRHQSQSDAILAFAAARQRPIAAIINTHWHLDHNSGNGRLKAIHPKARLYTTPAVHKVLAPGGFLARNLEDAKKALAATTDPVRRDEIQIFIKTMEERSGLLPDVPLTASQPMTLAGRPLDVNLTDHAVTDADVWLYDKATRVAVIGDLVTVPVPYFESACPERWGAALDQVWATPFETAVPGHGAAMSRAQFDTYRQAYGAFVACVQSARAPGECAAAWAEGVAPLTGNDPARRQAVAANAEYYVGYLRSNGGKAPDCTAK